MRFPACVGRDSLRLQARFHVREGAIPCVRGCDSTRERHAIPRVCVSRDSTHVCPRGIGRARAYVDPYCKPNQKPYRNPNSKPFC
ncbi:gp47 [Mycobacterium phage Barnyard]|uniref:Uncharacterized protein n=1 Tax=Mycobacterium phage Barnyard TaxID=205880 RepID=Q856C5_9CAUD|nr:gp47 [Mycobacterium phage Barnyard]AAN02101.1 hypothetical protein PBI_BARNYARD_47 [Mycobacterium phage Barnyard]